MRMSFAAVAAQSAPSTMYPRSLVLAPGHTRSIAARGTRAIHVSRDASAVVGNSRHARSGRIMLPNPAFERTRISVVVCD